MVWWDLLNECFWRCHLKKQLNAATPVIIYIIMFIKSIFFLQNSCPLSVTIEGFVLIFFLYILHNIYNLIYIYFHISNIYLSKLQFKPWFVPDFSPGIYRAQTEAMNANMVSILSKDPVRLQNLTSIAQISIKSISLLRYQSFRSQAKPNLPPPQKTYSTVYPISVKKT